MRIKIRQGVIYVCDEGLEDRPIGTIFPNATEQDERIIECGSEAVIAIEEFVKEVNSGTFKPRTVTRRFEQLLERHAV